MKKEILEITILHTHGCNLQGFCWVKIFSKYLEMGHSCNFMSLVTPHPIWVSAGHSPSKVAMATVQACMVSGRYRTDSLSRHWYRNVTGYCTLHEDCKDMIEDIPHVLQHCKALSSTRLSLVNYTKSFASTLPQPLRVIIEFFCNPSCSRFCNFLLDSSSLPEIIALKNDLGPNIIHTLFDLTRTWVYIIHRERLKMRGEWKRGANPSLII